jgi:hypothetical protein
MIKDVLDKVIELDHVVDIWVVIVEDMFSLQFGSGFLSRTKP